MSQNSHQDQWTAVFWKDYPAHPKCQWLFIQNFKAQLENCVMLPKSRSHWKLSAPPLEQGHFPQMPTGTQETHSRAIRQEQGFNYLSCTQRDKWPSAAVGGPRHFLSAIPLKPSSRLLWRCLPSHLTQFLPQLIPNTAQACKAIIFFTQWSKIST